jgi:hypothetical protein
MAYLIALPTIEEQHLIRFGDCLAAPHVPDVYTAIWKNHVRGRRALFRSIRMAVYALENRVSVLIAVTFASAM